MYAPLKSAYCMELKLRVFRNEKVEVSVRFEEAWVELELDFECLKRSVVRWKPYSRALSLVNEIFFTLVKIKRRRIFSTRLLL